MLTVLTGDLLNEIRGLWLMVCVPQMKKLGRSWGGIFCGASSFLFWGLVLDFVLREKGLQGFFLLGWCYLVDSFCEVV